MTQRLCQSAGIESRSCGEELQSADRPILFAYLMPIDRYLTKICDQVIALLSTTHTTSLVWGDENSNTDVDMDDGDEDRLYRFKVEKRNEQEENAALRPGFKVILWIPFVYKTKSYS